MILGFNTATTRTYITLIDEGRVVDEKFWKAEQNEAEKLLPELKRIIEENNLQWKDLRALAVVTGPGPFTALRVSIAIANALAYALGIKIADIPVDDFWRFRIGDEFALYAGGNKVYYHGVLYDVQDFLSQVDEKTKIAGQLRDTHIKEINLRSGKYVDEKELGTLGQFLSENIDQFEFKDNVKPRYFSKPYITVSKKQYK